MSHICYRCKQPSSKRLCRSCKQLQNRKYYNSQKADKYAHILKRTLRRERRHKSDVHWNKDDVKNIVQSVWDDCCAITGESDNLILCRWNNSIPLSLQNHVCLSTKLAKTHSYVTNPEKYYASFSKQPLLRLSIAEHLLCNSIN